MNKITPKNYFDDSSCISNSMMRNFVRYNKYWNRTVTDQKFHAMNISKELKFVETDPVIIWKIVDKYFDWFWEKVWQYYIPVAQRKWKEIQAIIDEAIKTHETETKKEISEIDRQNIIDEVNWDYREITKWMESTAKNMIKAWLAFKKLQDFLKTEWIESQKILTKDVEIVDKEWEIHTIKIKWLPDFVDSKNKIVVDLKTSGSSDMIVEWLQFKQKPMLTAAYIRQLSMYNKMLGGWYNWVIALVWDNNDIMWIDIPNIILEKCWDETIGRDLLELDKFIKNPKEYETSIFDLSLLDVESEELKL